GEAGRGDLSVAPAIGGDRAVALAHVDEVRARGGMNAGELPQARAGVHDVAVGDLAGGAGEGCAVTAGGGELGVAVDGHVEPAHGALAEIDAPDDREGLGSQVEAE